MPSTSPTLGAYISLILQDLHIVENIFIAGTITSALYDFSL